MFHEWARPWKSLDHTVDTHTVLREKLSVIPWYTEILTAMQHYPIKVNSKLFTVRESSIH